MEENGDTEDREETNDEVKGEERQKCTRHFRASCTDRVSNMVFIMTRHCDWICLEEVSSTILLFNPCCHHDSMAYIVYPFVSVQSGVIIFSGCIHISAIIKRCYNIKEGVTVDVDTTLQHHKSGLLFPVAATGGSTRRAGCRGKQPHSVCATADKQNKANHIYISDCCLETGQESNPDSSLYDTNLQTEHCSNSNWLLNGILNQQHTIPLCPHLLCASNLTRTTERHSKGLEIP